MHYGNLLFKIGIMMILIFLALAFMMARYFSKLRQRCCKNNAISIAFFHPHCSAGGGGERVLWKAIEALGQINKEGMNIEVVIYTSDSFSESYHEGAL